MWSSPRTSAFERKRENHEKFHSVRIDGDVGTRGLRSRCPGELLSPTLRLEPRLRCLTVLHSDMPLNVLQVRLLHTHFLLLALHDNKLCSCESHRGDTSLFHQSVRCRLPATMHASLLCESLGVQIAIFREELP
ncbi:MAG: hypothetical protein JWP89_6846 [Schlesneria sp.]|nr:hypothetical protein [Schlesneria sp.]